MPPAWAQLATHLESALDLDYPPVAMARVNQQPDGIVAWTQAEPSACSFWRRAEHEVFFADELSHMGCPIGALVMGFELSGPKQEELMNLIGNMCAVAYLHEDEVNLIPKFDPGPTGVVYGPLADFPLEPDNVILWITPKQTMYLEEALGGTRWSGQTTTVFGRPACGVLPASASTGEMSLSLGCIGMRTFTEIPDGHSLATLPRESLSSLETRLATTLAANTIMEAAYKEMKAAI